MTQQKPSSDAPAGRPPPGPNQTQDRRILSSTPASAPVPAPTPAPAPPGHFQEVPAPGYYVGGTPPVYYQAVAPQPPHPVGLPPLHPVSSFHHPQPQPQPQAAVGYHLPQGHWNTGLCDCFEDAPNCCITLWCPCITFGQTSEIIDRGSSSCGTNGVLYALILMLTGCHCVYACMYRSKLKLQYDMPQNSFDDFCIHCCCHYCALCQEYRELQRRGFEVTLGWHGNMERMNRGMGVATNPPIVQGGMTR